MNAAPIFPSDEGGLRAAVDVLAKGGVIGFPTDTVYGLACRADLPESVAQISRIKGRPTTQPLILMVSDLAELSAYAVLPPAGKELAARHWPGPLTLILPAHPAGSALGGGETVGVRIPRHQVALELLRRSGPLATTSANAHGEAPVLGAREALERLVGLAGAVQERAGDRVPGEPSSILDLGSEPPRLIREGRLSRRELGLS